VSTELFRSPLSLLSNSKTHSAAGNRESKCQGFNDRTFLAGENPCRGCSKRARSPKASSLSKTPERLKNNKTNGLAGDASAHWAQPIRPKSALLCHCTFQLIPPQLPIGHWAVSCVTCAHRGYRLDYLQGQGRLTRPPRDGSLRIHLSRAHRAGPSGLSPSSPLVASCLTAVPAYPSHTQAGLVWPRVRLQPSPSPL